MKKEHQETLLQTIKGNLERNEKGEVYFIPDENGKWNVVQGIDLKKYGLIKHFEPQYTPSFDKYGNSFTSDNKKGD